MTIPPPKHWIDEATVAQLHGSLLASAMRLAARRSDAEDLVQETWFSALRSQASFDGRSSPRTWLVSIMRRRALDARRRARPSEPFQEARHPVAPDDSAGPERCDRRAALGRALRAVDQLPLLERMAVLLCDLQDLERDVARNAFRSRALICACCCIVAGSDSS